MRISTDVAHRITARLNYLEKHGMTLAIDGDVHPTPFANLPQDIAQKVRSDPGYYHGRPLLQEDLIATMDLADVDMALCWQNPAVLRYGPDKDENHASLRKANKAIAQAAIDHPTRVIPAGWTDPKALGTDNAKTLARDCVTEFAMPVVKMNPAQNEYPITDPMVLEVVDEIVSLGAVPAFHFGSDGPYTPPEGLEEIAKRHPDVPVIGVHMAGGGGHFVHSEENYLKARALGLRQPNVFYVLSAKRDPHIESALLAYVAAGEPYCRNIVAGSDAPYGNMLYHFGGFRALFDGMSGGSYTDPRLKDDPNLMSQQMIDGFMGGNLARLVVEADRRILSLAAVPA
ncbi:amidohydrolase family protein [Pseudoruegeria sp. HB172150]|uniref:amidohydrolase family protein n=1 Tax=Pseudoruegeria sp. HB172150 TaxID=2721164 RepID=UPI0015534DE1|nr:amidohydrolase family protein [Pseudoruegeria sp. HB172150]